MIVWLVIGHSRNLFLVAAALGINGTPVPRWGRLSR
jgi:hypothetical protein